MAMENYKLAILTILVVVVLIILRNFIDTMIFKILQETRF